jgi:hypothetical protein
MMQTFKKPSEEVEGALRDMLATGLEWKVLFAARLNKSMTFLGHHDTLLHLVIMVMTAHPLHLALNTVLGADSEENFRKQVEGHE